MIYIKHSYRLEALLASLSMYLLNNEIFYNSLNHILGISIGESPETIGNLKLLIYGIITFIVNIISCIGGILIIIFSILIFKDLITKNEIK